MKRIFSSLCLVTAVALGGIVVFGQNYKIKQTMSMGGHNITSTTFVKGSRKRTETSGMMGMGADLATIEQCDLKRTVQVNDKKKLYYVNETDRGAAGANRQGRDADARPSGAVARPKKGGTITQISNITDTGERKQMFGLTARHIKTSMTTTSSPDACNQADMAMETDGWYVDLPAFTCPASTPTNPYAGMNDGERDCQDNYVFKSTGSGKLGFPLELTQTMRSGGQTTFTQTISTIEFSKAMLDDALFNVPSDYRLASSSQELYGQPDYSAMMGGGRAESEATDIREPTNTRGTARGNMKRPGMVRIGVLIPTNRGEGIVSTASLQSFLARQVTSGKVEGVAVASEADARAAGCDYILTSDISKLRQSTAGKIGGIFGGVAGVPTAGKYEAQVEYKLTSLADGRSALQNKASEKAETDAQRAAESILATEARAVIAAAQK